MENYIIIASFKIFPDVLNLLLGPGSGRIPFLSGDNP
jgi:hypothetical protein